MAHDWSKLNHLQLGKYAEYFAKMEFTKAGLDVYTSEVDDKGIDFIVRKNQDEYFEIQVKALLKSKYAFVTKETFSPRKNLLLVLVLFETEPIMLLIPSLAWKQKQFSFLADHDYIGKKSKPEYGINISTSSLKQLQEHFSFKKRITYLTD
jgi:hypothetical protein